MDQKKKNQTLENGIMAMMEEIEARQHILFSGLNSGVDKQSQTVNEVGQTKL